MHRKSTARPACKYVGCFRPCDAFHFLSIFLSLFEVFFPHFQYFVYSFTNHLFFRTFRWYFTILLHAAHHVHRIFGLLFAFLLFCIFPWHFTAIFPDIIELIHLSVLYMTWFIVSLCNLISAYFSLFPFLCEGQFLLAFMQQRPQNHSKQKQTVIQTSKHH